MDPLTTVGAAASIITILETTQSIFVQLVGLTRDVYQYSEKSEKIIRQCTFDTDTINAISETIKRNPNLFQDETELSSLQQVLFRLQLDLLTIKARLEPFRQPSIMRRLSFALQEQALSELDRDVFNWSQRLYIRFSFLLFRIQTELYQNGAGPSTLRGVPEILSQHLMRDIATKAKILDYRSLQRDAQLDQISLIGPPSMQMKASTAAWKTSEKAIIEFRPYALSADPRVVSELEQCVGQLAAIFQHAKPSLMYTLSCQGYYIDKSNSRFGLIYRFPPGSTDYMRLDTLIETKPQPICSLSMRFEIARRLAVAVAFLHGVGWVHKAIQTRRVLLFTRTTSDRKCIGDAYLTGFQDARGVHGDSMGHEADLSWKTKLYRHPDRHSYQNNAYFTTGHDIFALGVVLLELGLWRLLAIDRYEELLKTAKPHEYKMFLVTMAGMVDCQMGSLYQSVVKRCLEVDASISEACRVKLMGDVLTDLEQLVRVV
ncbi:hypothetical protein FOQG_16942 [Fusarium oxysporum f. sp. raphani 54005]|uniref:Protein kinase domain-containing protein n=2 Tax=Fusarium oxysporum f. sp. raphani TaxID=96318 RepID=X0C6L9_FUSOX|nr:hypothetical protein FOQG_16942 [Fusarium oxysporum f. sp. raphani 54005]KAG7428279.1 hypothetical protein Forpi1262_v011206 [Fusarium oxysporum f. sp. raphani]